VTVRPGGEGWLVAIAVAGQTMGVALTALLARNLDAGQFGAFATAAAGFVLLVTAAPMGAEKLALQVLPPALRDRDQARTSAFLSFALRRAAIGTALAVTAGIVWALNMGGAAPATALAILAAMLALPVAVGAHLGLEILTAAGQPRHAAAVFRLAVPGTALVCVGLVLLSGGQVSAVLAILAWTLGWVLGAALIWRRLWRIWPEGTTAKERAGIQPDWAPAARRLWVYRLLLGAMAQAGILAMAWSGAGEVEIGTFAAVQALTGLGLVLVTATNRLYAARLSVLIDQGDDAAILGLNRQRLRWLALPLTCLLAVAILIPGSVLRLFNEQFAEAGTGPLRVLALAGAVSMVLALAPTYLKFRHRPNLALAIMTGAALLQLGLLGLMPWPLTAGAAALSQAAGTVLMFAGFAVAALADLRRRQG
jgi:O-antigen/teichoic acid export membrane protein